MAKSKFIPIKKKVGNEFEKVIFNQRKTGDEQVREKLTNWSISGGKLLGGCKAEQACDAGHFGFATAAWFPIAPPRPSLPCEPDRQRTPKAVLFLFSVLTCRRICSHRCT